MEHRYSWLRYALIIFLLPLLRCMWNYKSEESQREFRRIEKSITPFQTRIAAFYAYAYLIGILVCALIAIDPYLRTSHVLPVLTDFALLYTRLTIVIELLLGSLIVRRVTTYRINTLTAANTLNCDPGSVQLLRLLGPALYFICLFLSC